MRTGDPSEDIPIACNLGALTDSERARRSELANQAVRFAESIEPTEDGYAVGFPSDRPSPAELLEWIALERRCCPFLRFELAFGPGDDGSVRLSVGGGPGVREFLAAALFGGSCPPDECAGGSQ